MQRNELVPLTMHQLMMIEHLKENTKSTKKELESIEIHPKFRNDVNQATAEMVSLGYIRKCVKAHRPAYELV